MKFTRFAVIIAAFALFGQGAGRAATTLLPNGMQCFSGVNGAYSSGSLNMFIPNTTTPKSTWQDPNQASLNTQPIQLDANGCAVIYGVGQYRQQLFDGPVVGGVTTGNQIWDKLTADTSAYNSAFWAGISGGTPNAITIVDPGFNNTDGSVINFMALFTNTGATTISVSAGTPITVVKDTSSGPVALSGSEIVANNIVSVTYDATNVLFHLAAAQSVATQAAIAPPQGYLNLIGQSSGDVVQTADVIGSTTVFYSPFNGNQIPIFNGATFSVRTFGELTLSLTAAGQLANTIYDVCAFNNAGAVTLVTGPAWSSSAAGSGNRGTGAGTAQLIRLNGIWVNAQSFVGVNGSNTFSIPADQCTYVGSLSIDATAGQVTAHRTYGQSRKFGVWNAYNRQTIILQAGDSTASWSYTSATIRESNGGTTNTLAVFSGLPEELAYTSFKQKVQYLLVSNAAPGSSTSTTSVGLGLNSTTTFSGMTGFFNDLIGTSGGNYSMTIAGTSVSEFVLAPSLGINNINALESGGTTSTFFGTQTNMNLTASWRG